MNASEVIDFGQVAAVEPQLFEIDNGRAEASHSVHSEGSRLRTVTANSAFEPHDARRSQLWNQMAVVPRGWTAACQLSNVV